MTPELEVFLAGKEPLKCERCGATDSSVEEGPDPFDLDVNGDDTPRTLCGQCREDSANEI